MKRLCINCNQAFDVLATTEVSGSAFCTRECYREYNNPEFTRSFATGGASRLSEALMQSPLQPKPCNTLGH